MALLALFATVLSGMPSSEVGFDLFALVLFAQAGVLSVLPVAGLTSLRRQPASP
jgi:hypothetical protein